jgi:hypothetical protein
MATVPNQNRDKLPVYFKEELFMYIDPETRVDDNRSTAWSFTLVSILGIILLILLDLDILPVSIADFQKIILSVVMGILFLIFLGIGIHSFLTMKQLRTFASKETSLDKEITEWFLKEYAEYMRGYSAEDCVNEDMDAEELYYPRYNRMSELILAEYPAISEEFKDHIIEELYSDLFPE